MRASFPSMLPEQRKRICLLADHVKRKLFSVIMNDFCNMIYVWH